MLELAKNLGGVLGFVFYGALVLWTYKDARRRIDDPILVATAVATSMLPIVGVLVYLLLRPPEYLADVRERELEIRAMERLGRTERCPYCKSHIEGSYLSCPVCATKLRKECRGCEKPLDPRWVLCPFCETEVPNSGGPRDVPPGPGRGKTTVPSRARTDVRAEPRSETRGASRRSSRPAPRRGGSDTDASYLVTPQVDTVVAPRVEATPRVEAGPRTEPFQMFAIGAEENQSGVPSGSGERV